MAQVTLYARATLTAAGTATIWTHVGSGFRWKLMNGFIGWRSATVTGCIVLLDGSAEMVRIGLNATSGWAACNFGDQGYPARASATSFRLQSESSGSVWSAFIGTTE